jgi:hypothetical protein
MFIFSKYNFHKKAIMPKIDTDLSFPNGHYTQTI